MDVITSKSNDKVKFLKSLNEKKDRMRKNCFYLEGIKVINEVLDSKKAINVEFIAYSSTILEKSDLGIKLLQRLKKQDGIEIIEFSKELLEYVTDTKTPQGVVAVLEIKEKDYIEILKSNSNIVIMDKIQDPGNIGTIIRTCDAFNIHNIIYLQGTGDIYSPKVVRSTMGSILRVDISKVNIEELDNFKKYAIINGYKIIGTSLKTNNYFEEYAFNNRNILVFSNEANGISKEIESICDDLIKINMSDSAESLNVGIAAGIVVHELYNK